VLAVTVTLTEDSKLHIILYLVGIFVQLSRYCPFRSIRYWLQCADGPDWFSRKTCLSADV